MDVTEKNAKKIIASAEKLPNGKKLTENYGALKALAQSDEVKRLISKMDGEELSSLQDGNAASAAEKLKKLLSSREGRELVKKVSEVTGI